MFKKGDFKRNMTTGWKFRLFLLLKLPLAFIVGLRLKSMTDRCVEISLPFKWLNTNPFKSMYFACLTMAAELSTGIVVMNLIDSLPQSFAMLVLKVEGDFVKRGLGKIVFRCEDLVIAQNAFERALEEKSPQQFVLKSIGYNEQNEPICSFSFTWSIKAK